MTFDPDPSRSPHALVAFGSSRPAAPGQDRARQPRLWARVTVFTGGAVGATPARDAVLMLAPILSVEALLAAPVAEPYTATWAQACAAAEPSPPEDAKNTGAFGGPLWDSAASHPMGGVRIGPQQGAYGPQHGAYAAQLGPYRAQQGPAVEDVFARVQDYARRYGAHPDFRARDLSTITRVNHYIASTYGEPLPAATLQAVRARLAAEM